MSVKFPFYFKFVLCVITGVVDAVGVTVKEILFEVVCVVGG